eukprot:3123650-Prymnesium_polylepis.1
MDCLMIITNQDSVLEIIVLGRNSEHVRVRHALVKCVFGTAAAAQVILSPKVFVNSPPLLRTILVSHSFDGHGLRNTREAKCAVATPAANQGADERRAVSDSQHPHGAGALFGGL